MSNQSNLKQLCFSFKGRINRTIFWGSTLVVFFSLAVLYKGIQNIPIFALLYVCIPIWVKRLHDLNKSGMLLLWGGIPIVCYILFWVSSIRAFMWASILFAIAGYLYNHHCLRLPKRHSRGKRLWCRASRSTDYKQD